jgi:hypothetical protein
MIKFINSFIALFKKGIVNLYYYFSNFFILVFNFNVIRCVYLSNINKMFKGTLVHNHNNCSAKGIALKHFFNSGDSFLVKTVFNIVFLFLSLNLFINFFVYTYYITFYVTLININLLFKLMYVYIGSTRVRLFSMKIIILISILLIHVPLQGIFFFFRVNKA